MGDSLKCKFCDKDATVHLTQIINNKIQKIDLCEACAQQKGFSETQGFSLSDMLMQLDTETVDDGKELSCQSCGYRTSDFRRTGRLGCSDCYSIFEPLLEPVLEDMHTGLKHVGKIPAHSLDRQSQSLKVKNLRLALSRAIAKEAYEDAAHLRDQIREMESATIAETCEKDSHD
jgi:protein arginine kinase activator